MFCIRTICRDLKRLSRPLQPALFLGSGRLKTNRILVVVFEPSCMVGLPKKQASRLLREESDRSRRTTRCRARATTLPPRRAAADAIAHHRAHVPLSLVALVALVLQADGPSTTVARTISRQRRQLINITSPSARRRHTSARAPTSWRSRPVAMRSGGSGASQSRRWTCTCTSVAPPT